MMDPKQRRRLEHKRKDLLKERAEISFKINRWKLEISLLQMQDEGAERELREIESALEVQ